MGVSCRFNCAPVIAGGKCHGIDAVFSLCTGPTSLEVSMRNARENLARVSQQALRAFMAGKEG